MKCRARAAENLALAKHEFALPPLLTDEEIAELLDKLEGLVKWANEIFAYAQDAAVNHGKEWPGFKVVLGRSNRKYRDETKAAEAAAAAGYTDIFKKTLLSVAEMEKLMGKRNFAEILGDLVIRPQGKPSLVPVSDKRPAVGAGNAKADFTEIKD